MKEERSKKDNSSKIKPRVYTSNSNQLFLEETHLKLQNCLDLVNEFSNVKSRNGTLNLVHFFLAEEDAPINSFGYEATDEEYFYRFDIFEWKDGHFEIKGYRTFKHPIVTAAINGDLDLLVFGLENYSLSNNVLAKALLECLERDHLNVFQYFIEKFPNKVKKVSINLKQTAKGKNASRIINYLDK